MQALPFADGSFDAVVCQFRVHVPAGQAAGVPRGSPCAGARWVLLANVWGLLDENPAKAILHETVTALYPADPPRFFETPYGYGRKGAAADIASAGWQAQLDAVNLDVDCAAVDLAEGYVRGTPLSHQLAERGADPDAVVRLFVDALVGAFGGERFTMRNAATVITAQA